MNTFIIIQENFPVGCVPPTFLVGRGLPNLPVGRLHCRQTPPGGIPPKHGPPGRQTPWEADPRGRQTCVKTLPCTKLYLLSVINKQLPRFPFGMTIMQKIYLAPLLFDKTSNSKTDNIHLKELLVCLTFIASKYIFCLFFWLIEKVWVWYPYWEILMMIGKRLCSISTRGETTWATQW